MGLIYTIPQGCVTVIRRFGKFARIQRPGLHGRLPWIEAEVDVRRMGWDDVANKDGVFVEVTEQQTDTPPRQCHTADNVTVTANASVYWRITDPRKALFEVDILPSSVSDVALNALRANIGTLSLDQVLTERQQMSERIAEHLQRTANGWGIEFTRVEIQELSTSDDISRAMQQQMEAERKGRAIRLETTAKAAAEVQLAEAEGKAAVARAAGQAKALMVLARAESEYLAQLEKNTAPDSAARILLAEKYLRGMAVITENPAHKVFLPNGFSGIMELVASSHAPMSGNEALSGGQS